MSSIKTEKLVDQAFRQAILAVFETNTGMLTPQQVHNLLPDKERTTSSVGQVSTACEILAEQESLQKFGTAYQLD